MDKEQNYVDGCMSLYRDGKLSLPRMGAKLAAARQHQAKVAAAACAVAAAAIADGTSEVAAARALGVDRGTLRAWLGK
jgi:hypothetical protein